MKTVLATRTIDIPAGGMYTAKEATDCGAIGGLHQFKITHS